MAKVIVLGNHTSSLRDSWWYFEQDDDGSLWVRYENDDAPEDKWRKPLSEVLSDSSTGSAKGMVEKLIGRLFEFDLSGP